MIILDIEATCDNSPSWNRDYMEIIQIGAVIMGADGKVITRYESYAKPSIHPELTKFCTELTGITQPKIDSAKPLREVLVDFNKWVTSTFCYHGGVWGSWGMYDRNQFIKDSQRQRIDLVVLDYIHHNLKNVWADAAGKRPMGLGKAIQVEGLQFKGRAHNALVDAENIARLKHIKHFVKDLSE